VTGAAPPTATGPETVAVVGAGIAGLATAWALAQRGYRVTVIDQGPIPNPLSASHDRHRLIRYFYPDESGYCLMVGQAYEAWEELWEDLGQAPYVETGSLALSRAEGDWADRARATLDEVGIGYDLVPPEVLGEDYPFLNMDGVRWGLFKARGGVLLADRILEALASRLAALGVGLIPDRPVASVDPEAGRIAFADGGELAADRLVIAAGAWVGRLMPDQAERFQPRRSLMVYVDPPEDHADAWATAPGLIDYGFPEDHWSIPPIAGTRLKLAAAHLTRPGDPDDNGPLTHAEAREVLAAYEKVLVGIDRYTVADSWACCYTLAPDWRFVVEPIGRTWLVSACSGHGFKMGALIGREVAAAIAGAAEPESLTRWASGLEV